MVPALASGQRLLVGRLPYLLGRPARGDTVVLRHPERPDFLLVKRIVGVPGDRLEMRAGRVTVNGAPMAPDVPDAEAGENRAWALGPAEYFVAGTAGEDSRSFGPVGREAIEGRAWLSYWPPERWGLLPRAVKPPVREGP